MTTLYMNHNDLDTAAKTAIDQIVEGERTAFDGWLAYGAVLLRGREAYPGDLEFGRWKNAVLSDGFRPHQEEERAAMWAADDRDLFQKVREAFPKSRTVRGLYNKYHKNIEMFAKPMMTDDQKQRQEEVEAGKTVLANKHTDLALIGWAKNHGLAVDITRGTDWGNPFVMPQDGNREQVVAKYRTYLEGKKSLQKRIDAGDLSGKVLICCCAPEACHGDVLIEWIERDDFDLVDDESKPVEPQHQVGGPEEQHESMEPLHQVGGRENSVANNIIRTAKDKAEKIKVLEGIVEEIFYDGFDPETALDEAEATKTMLLEVVARIDAKLEDLTKPTPKPGPLLERMLTDEEIPF